MSLKRRTNLYIDPINKLGTASLTGPCALLQEYTVHACDKYISKYNSLLAQQLYIHINLTHGKICVKIDNIFLAYSISISISFIQNNFVQQVHGYLQIYQNGIIQLM